MPTRTSSFRPRAPALPWLPPAGAEPLRERQSRLACASRGAVAAGTGLHRPELSPCGGVARSSHCATAARNPCTVAACARSSCCSCAMAARNSCVVTAWRGPASARQRSRAHPWRWRLHATPPHPVPPRVGRGCAANHARRRRTRWGLGRSCRRGALYEVVIRIGFAVAGAASRRRRRASVRNVRGKRVDGSFWSLPRFSFLFFHKLF